MGQGYEDHLVTPEADIPEAKGLYTNDIQRLYKVASAIVHLSQQDLDLSTYIGQIASLKEEFLTVMPLTPDVGAQQTQLDKFFMVLTLIGLRPDLESIRDQILGSSSVPSLDDVFARLLRISSTQTLPSDSASDSSVLVLKLPLEEDASGTRGRGQRPHCTYCNKLGHTRDRCYQLHGRPPRTAHMAQSSDSPLPQPPSSSASQTSQASIASVAQPGNASAYLTHTSSLGPWILDSGASDHLSGNKDLFSSITTTSDLPTVTLANGSQTVAKGIVWPFLCLLYLSFLSFILLNDRSTGKTIGIGRESQASITSPQIHLLQFAFPLMLLSSFTILGKHTRVSFPKRLNNRAKSPFELVHTDVWGPCRTASTLGFQYLSLSLMTILDVLAQFTSFMSHHGILHQSSCAHTPQQNGVAERKNRHLVETARTLLLHSHIPHSLLFPDQPLYSFLLVSLVVLACSYSHSWTGQAFRQSHEVPLLGYSRLQKVYHRRPRVVAPLPFPEAPADSLPIPSASPAPALPSPNDLPIAVRKGTRSTRNPHPIYNFLSYHRLSSPYSAFVSAISSVSLPKSTHEALSHPGWRQAMVDEMAALHSNGTWDLVVLPSVDRLKARLVAKGYTQVYGSDYGDTFSPVAKIASVRLLLSMAAMCSWPLYQLDIKNVFLHGDFAEEVYMEQPPSFVAQGSLCIYLVVYVDDIVITGSDQDAQSSSGVVLSQRKTGGAFRRPGRYRRLVGKLNYLTITRPDISFPVSVVSQFLQSPCDSHWDAVIRILRYIKSTPGQGVLYENRGHTQVVGYTDADWAGSPTDRRSTSGYCVFIGGNLISWKSKKQDVVARSSAEAEYRAMALATCELIWLRHLLQELRFGKDEQMKLICDNQAALHIASNPVFHERTKHIEVDCHFIREKIASGCVATSFVNSNDQLADIFTKSLRGPRIKYICNKLGAYDVYAPA
ncbi:Retrovirus-related Pol polyprotein from transposon RE2 [Vitis vinifera]|uniref:Retrovirus-related Pol polyprotein from transposon RE2 n=1 Tax=Vitis vinifera TaxID=29760 RepID=A0A438DLH5_VITVI|nr:Retrovirus-related Pol polyprotein from transposon RE2 [Vitis vinifera]